MFRSYTILVVASLLTATCSCIAVPSHPLPIVDLGYEIYEATAFDASNGLYNFSNIRYAAPPTGNRRFRAPHRPETNRSAVQSARRPDRICPQADSSFLRLLSQWVPEFLAGQTVFQPSSLNASSESEVTMQDPRSTEDCLFLDITVPKNVFDKRQRNNGAAVLVWIHGGSFSSGSKSSSGNPTGLIQRSQQDSDGVIFVSINYRLGAFGWLSGPSFQEDGTANAGLYDQRLALHWVQQHIKAFGGDPSRVTAIGESAGAGSIMHQITAYGNRRNETPFQQAILQSPGWEPVVSNQQQEQTFARYLSILNVTSLSEARRLSYRALQTANMIQVGSATLGKYGFGPTVDGDFAPALPGELLLHGQFDRGLQIMVSHNADEGLIFTSPYTQNNTIFEQYVSDLFPTAKAYPFVLEYIFKTLYPSDLSGKYGYTSQIGRLAALIGEVFFSCNTFYLNKAFHDNTHAYIFAIPPALHGADVSYTYYNGANSGTNNDSIAITMQEWITTFAVTGDPNRAGLPFFNLYGVNATVQNLDPTGISGRRDPASNERCIWWQQTLYK